ncbi:unnamed protein product [Caenorhabditis sp. 36 PRJEB53466]|nr:unnamed protein product [Caenorhabditis sp. 36 PRJEB53466]
MSGSIREIGFILNDIKTTDIFQRYSIYLKIENYEPIKIGDFGKTDLPKGQTFPVLLGEKWFDRSEIELEVRKNGEKYSAIVGFNCRDSNAGLYGTLDLFNERNREETLEITCTIVIERPERRESVRARETQTVPVRRTEAAVQTQNAPETTKTDASTCTSGRSMSVEQIEPIIASSIARHLQEHRREAKRSKDPPKESQEPADPKPSDEPDDTVHIGPDDAQLNSFNLVPRLTRLRELDAQIAEKSRILRELDVELEVKRKLNQVKMKREEIEKEKKKVKEPSESSTSSRSSSSSSTSSTSSSSESSSSSTEPSSSAISTTTSSKSSSISSKKPPAPPRNPVKPARKPDETDESTIEDPFSAHKSPEPEEPQPAISPTTAYLESMKQRLLAQYQEKFDQ